MSGIYIPDIRLPVEGDFELWIAIRKDGSFTYNVRGSWQDGKQKVVPVPEHGDLIDRDYLKQTHCAECTLYPDNCLEKSGKECDWASIVHLNVCPIVIPAEEG